MSAVRSSAGRPGLRARLGLTAARPLGRSASATIAQALASDPVASCMVAARFDEVGHDRARLGGIFWGVDAGRSALAFAGTNIIVFRGKPAAVSMIADAVGETDRACASITGRADDVLRFWNTLAPSWGPAREVRPDQPLLICPNTPLIAADDVVRRVRPGQLETYLPAAVSMFTEEVGIDPTAGDEGKRYRARMAGLIASGHAFARFDGSTVVYKAEIGALSRQVALIQGVWVHPRWRGRGIAAPATAAVVRAIHRMGRLPSLYVNSHNAAARATYHRIGFEQVGTFASVLF